MNPLLLISAFTWLLAALLWFIAVFPFLVRLLP